MFKTDTKNCTKVDTSYGFIEKFVLNSEDYDYGKKFMEVGLSSAEESYNDQPLDSLENALIRYADDKHMTALLHNLKKYLNENKDNFTKETNPIIRDTRSNQQGNISSSKEAVVAYIKNLWVDVQSRLKYSDCTDGATSFSEAPAESIFSYYERVREGRESLSLDRSTHL